MKRHTNIIITAVASLIIVTLAGREFIKNHKKESNDKSSTNVSENTCEDIPDTSISDTSVADTNTPDTSTSEADILDTTYENNKEQFYISEIPDDIFEKMQGKSYKADCTLPRENLRYIHVLHVGFDNQVHEGELVVNKDIADDVLEIFKELYESGYQIEKVRLIDEYDADDEASMSDNNSSAFNFRFISHTTKISKHGMGMAVDINTLYNPYVKTVDGELSIEPANAADYVDRSRDFSHKIDAGVFFVCHQFGTKLFTRGQFAGNACLHSKQQSFMLFRKAVEYLAANREVTPTVARFPCLNGVLTIKDEVAAIPIADLRLIGDVLRKVCCNFCNLAHAEQPLIFGAGVQQNAVNVPHLEVALRQAGKVQVRKHHSVFSFIFRRYCTASSVKS